MTTPWDTWWPLIISLSILAILIWILSLGSSLIQQWYADHRAAKTKEEEHQHRDTVRPVSPAPDGAEQSEHRRAEQRYWKRSLVVSAASAMVAFVAVCFAAGAFFAAHDQADTARRAMFANDRPWVKPDSITVSNMDIDDTDVTVWAKIMVKNVGKSPAEGVFFIPYILLPDLDTDHLASMIEICNKTKASGASVFRALLFPDEVKNIEHAEYNAIFTRFTADLVKAKDVRWQKRLAGITEYNKYMESLGLGDKQITPEPKDIPFFTTFTLAGCITYSAYAAPDIYQTTFTVHLRRAVPGWRWGGAFDTSKRGPIPLQEIIQEDPFAGDFAN
jgi:hypothetical protein